MFWNLLKKNKNNTQVIESLVNIIREISFNEHKINSLQFDPFVCHHFWGVYKDYLTIQLKGTPNQIAKLENLFISLQKKDMDSIKHFMKEIVNEVRAFYFLEPLQECIFFSPALWDKNIMKKIKRIKGNEENDY